MRATASDVAICRHRLSRVEYNRAVEAGAFKPNANLELIDGDLNAMTPEAVGIALVADCLRRVFGRGFYVRIQHPLAADDYSEPDPDVAVVKGAIRDYDKGHPTYPTSAVLVVEVSNESLRYDRTVKQRLYARCGIPETGSSPLPEARLEIYCNPAGDRYQSVTNHTADDKVAPLSRPEAQIVVGDPLP